MTPGIYSVSSRAELNAFLRWQARRGNSSFDSHSTYERWQATFRIRIHEDRSYTASERSLYIRHGEIAHPSLSSAFSSPILHTL